MRMCEFRMSGLTAQNHKVALKISRIIWFGPFHARLRTIPVNHAFL